MLRLPARVKSLFKNRTAQGRVCYKVPPTAGPPHRPVGLVSFQGVRPSSPDVACADGGRDTKASRRQLLARPSDLGGFGRVSTCGLRPVHLTSSTSCDWLRRVMKRVRILFIRVRRPETMLQCRPWTIKFARRQSHCSFNYQGPCLPACSDPNGSTRLIVSSCPFRRLT